MAETLFYCVTSRSSSCTAEVLQQDHKSINGIMTTGKARQAPARLWKGYGVLELIPRAGDTSSLICMSILLYFYVLVCRNVMVSAGMKCGP